jgi:hypothetical protein
MPQARGREAIHKTNLVNLKRLWQIPVVRRLSSIGFFPTSVYGKTVDSFQEIG